MTASRILTAAAAVAVLAGSALADGMIVPIRPEIAVRGHWAVKYHHVNITVRDQVASVHIDQEFVNTGKGMIEVEYLFPVPPGAAIDSMTLMVNGQEFAAKLLEADKAREIYNDIVRRKKDPALLEYAGFGLYRTKAFPLEPGKPCKVIVTYKNLCKRDGKLTEVWYPLNTEKYSSKPIDSVRVKVDVKTEADITAVYSPSHGLSVDRKDARHVVATYEAKDALPVIDFQMYYKSADEKIGATLLTHQPDLRQDGYFMMLVSPNPTAAAGATVPKDVIVVLDRSGSMSGEKIEQAREALLHVVKNLNAEDRFNIITYSDDVEPMFDELRGVSDKSRREAMDRIDRIEATGGTNIHGALQAALKMLPGRKGEDARPAYVIFVTDGKPTVGVRNEEEILRDARKCNEGAARLFTFGVGYNVNIRLLDKLAMDNGGKSDYVKPKEPVETKIASLYNKIKYPVMTDITVEVDGIRLRDKYPREVGDLFDGDQITLVGRYHGEDLAKTRQIKEGQYHTTLIVRGVFQGKKRTFEYPVIIRAGGQDVRYGFVEKLWAMRRVGFLMDEVQLRGKSKEVVDEIIRLSTQYGIITPYTSFLADETTRLADGRANAARGREKLDDLAAASDGWGGQAAGEMRSDLAKSGSTEEPGATREPAAPAVEEQAKKSGAVAGNAVVLGASDKKGYESGRRTQLDSVRNVGNQSIYRRGKLWVAANASDLDPEKDKDKIEEIERFSEEYFELVKLNNREENQMLSTQAEGEELLVRLQGRAYRVR